MMAWIIWFDELRRGCCWSKEWLWRQRAGQGGQEDDEDGRRPTTTGMTMRTRWTTTKMDDDEDDDAEDDAEDDAMTLAGADVQMI